MQFKEEVERTSGQALKLDFVSEASGNRTDELQNAPKSSTAQISVSLLSGYRELIPGAGLFTLPFLFKDPEVAWRAAGPASMMRRALDKAIFAATGARVLLWAPAFPEAIFSKGISFKTPGFIAGKQLAALGDRRGVFLKLCGGFPAISQGSLMPSRILKQVEAWSAPLDLANQAERVPQFDHIVLIRHFHEEMVAVIQERVWQGLSDTEQRVLVDAARLAEGKAREALSIAEKDTIAQISHRGVMIEELSAPEEGDWKSCSSAMAEDFLRTSDPFGLELMNAYRRLLGSMHGNPSIGQ